MDTVTCKGDIMNYTNHPCYNPEAAVSHARVHLPVARGCNIQCNYCNRKFDCVNESRPGVTSAVLSPQQAVYYLEKVISLIDTPVSVAGIAGPGDPFADGSNTIETLRLIRSAFPEILLCVASNGLNLSEYVDDLTDIGVKHVTVTINSVDPLITSRIIKWVRFNNRVYRGIDAAKILIEKQLLAVELLVKNGINVKINSIVIPGINDLHIPVVAQTVARLGADVINCMPLHPVEETEFFALNKPDHEMMQKVRWAVSRNMKVIKHCQMCRADAAGKLGSNNSSSITDLLNAVSNMPLNPREKRPFIAVASREGMLINEHLGKSEYFYIYSIDDDSFPIVDIRKAPDPGSGTDRWNKLAELLSDCRSLLVYQTGEPPKTVLNQSGIKVITSEGLIDHALQSILAGTEPVPVVTVKPCSMGCQKKSQYGCG